MNTIKIILTVLIILIFGCDDAGDKPKEKDHTVIGRDSWKIVQEDIFASNCVDCHTVGTSFANQSDLLLTPDVAYDQLMNHPVNNQSALDNNLERLGTEGLSSLYKSFLWEKINAPDKEHFYGEHPHYGSLMPLGMPYLTNGQLEFIRQWIVAGAPETGVVADSSLFDDTTRFVEVEFAPLTPPENGIQVHVGPFEVQPHYEREFLNFVNIDTLDEVYIKQYEISMRSGSHHFILYTFTNVVPPMLVPDPGEYRDYRDANGNYIINNLAITSYHVYFAGTQWPYMNYHFPPGVALKVDINNGLDQNSHYINRTDEVQIGEVYTNIYFADPSEVEHEAQVMFINKTDFELPPHEITTLEHTISVGERIHIFQLFSHAHEHMLEFSVEIVGGDRDGELVYFAYDWEHPPILDLDPPITLEAGEGLKLNATYDNWTDKTLRFGLLGEDEMMILFGYYYTD
jgi:hypothetical protein